MLTHYQTVDLTFRETVILHFKGSCIMHIRTVDQFSLSFGLVGGHLLRSREKLYFYNIAVSRRFQLRQAEFGTLGRKMGEESKGDEMN